MFHYLKRYARTFFVVMAILVLCLLPSEDLDKIDLLKVDFEDVVVHLLMFAGFSVVFFLDMNKEPSRHAFLTRAIYVAAISLSFGMVTEFLQFWFASLNRTASLTDWCFDVAGTVTGIAVIWITKRSRGPAV